MATLARMPKGKHQTLNPKVKICVTSNLQIIFIFVYYQRSNFPKGHFGQESQFLCHV